MAKRNYQEWSKEELVREIIALKKQKTYGLVWEREKTKEDFDLFINWEGEKTKEEFSPESKDKFPVLAEVKDKEINSDKDEPVNLLIEGDNYHSLAVLNFTHKNAIDVIYIDPPYNTGNEDFKYNDKFVDKEDGYRHSKWISFMSKRLALAKNLLSESGTIFISIDDNEFAQLRLLCDDIFGEENFVIDIIWNSRKSVSSDAIVSLNHNHTLVYAKNLSLLREQVKKNGKFKLPIDEDKFSNPDNDLRGSWVADPFEAAGVRKNLSYGIKNPNTSEVFYPVKGRHWAVLEEEYFKLLKEGKIIFGKNGKGKPSRKRFLREAKEKGSTPKSIWDDVGTTTNGTQELEDMFGEKVFNNPKPVSLIKRIIELGTNKQSIVLDFFAGSGTTGHAVLRANKDDDGNRKFILCTNNELTKEKEAELNKKGFKKGDAEFEKEGICQKVCYPRISKAIKGYVSINKEKIEGLGGNLKYFKTDFVEAEQTDKNKRKLVDNCTEMLCVKECTFDKVKDAKKFKIFKNDKLHLGIIFDDEYIDEFVKEAEKINSKIHVYVFSHDDSVPTNEFKTIKNKVTLCPIPETILKVYRKVFKND